jgi:aspartate/tyrosine/aromatic aminotransferase
MQATCGGTQAVSMLAGLAEIEAIQAGYSPTLLVGIPTWSNHLSIFQKFEIKKFNHLNSTGYADLNSYKQALTDAPKKATLLIHGGKTHNPSGQNLSLQDFLELAEIINKKEIKVLIDSAYFGFGDTFENDADFLTQLFSAYDNVAIAQSYSKNASLYEHRAGALFVKTNNKLAVESQLQTLARISISMAPGLGQEIMIDILTTQFAEWEKEVTNIRETLISRRELLISKLPEKYQFLLDSKGMFGLFPLSPEEIQTLKSKYSIYIPGNGRVNFAGVNSSNVDYLINAFVSL